MPTPNYGYEKRQRELAKKNKKAEKLREKADRKANPEPLAQQNGEPDTSLTSLPPQAPVAE